AALAGIILACTVYRRRDLHLAVYAIVALMIGGSFRVAINRYLVTVGPLVLLLGLGALTALLTRLRWRLVAPITVSLLLAAIVAGNIANAHVRIDRAT